MTNESNSVRIALEAILPFFMHGILALSPERTSPEALLQLAVNLLFQSITQQKTLGINLLPFQH
jgi:hypothetical protein